MLDNLQKYKVVLASNSPRRQELLKSLGVDYSVLVKNDIDEEYPEDIKKKEVAEYLAVKKAKAYSAEIKRDNLLLITADTIVLCDKTIMGKPANAEEAMAMLKLLSGRSHKVITGVAITTPEVQRSFSTKTKVYFKRVSDEDIAYYVEHYKPFDKAGGYGIQEWIGMIAIDYIEGSYYNVMGLPLQQLYAELQRL
jgi:septum formation protein